MFGNNNKYYILLYIWHLECVQDLENGKFIKENQLKEKYPEKD